MIKKPLSYDRTSLIKLQRRECFERKRSLAAKAGRQPKDSLEQEVYEMNSSIYANLWFIYSYMEEITHAINSLTTAINKLPTGKDFKATKEELKHVVKEAAIPTKQDITEYKEREKRIKHIYG